MGRIARIDWDAQPLGRIEDRVLARRLGCTSQAVYYQRKRRGIAALRPQRQRCNPEMFSGELGTGVTDREIATKYGLTEAQVSRVRRKRGLPGSRYAWDEMKDLGSVPDVVLAERYGVDNKVVAAAR